MGSSARIHAVSCKASIIYIRLLIAGVRLFAMTKSATLHHRVVPHRAHPVERAYARPSSDSQSEPPRPAVEAHLSGDLSTHGLRAELKPRPSTGTLSTAFTGAPLQVHTANRQPCGTLLFPSGRSHIYARLHAPQRTYVRVRTQS